MEIDYSSLVNIRSPYSQFLDLHNPILYAVSKMVSRITSVLVLFFLEVYIPVALMYVYNFPNSWIAYDPHVFDV